MGAAIATLVTFFVSWVCNTIIGMKLSKVRIHWQKQLVMYILLCIQATIMIRFQNMIITSIGLLVILLINWRTFIWAKDKWKSLLKFKQIK